MADREQHFPKDSCFMLVLRRGGERERQQKEREEQQKNGASERGAEKTPQKTALCDRRSFSMSKREKASG